MREAPAGIGATDGLLYLIYTAASVSGLLLVKAYLPSLKQAIGSGTLFRTEVLFVAIGAFLYIFSFLVWMLILSRLELSVAYPIAIGLTLVFSTISAALMLGEQMAPGRIAGIVVVFAGVWLITRS